jgi:predicted nucleic acid-binding protein
MHGKQAFDTNIFIYALDIEAARANPQGREAISRALIQQPAHLSVQLVNEFTNVARKRFKLDYDQIHSLVEGLGLVHEIAPISLQTSELARAIAAESGYSYYDSLMLAAALTKGCVTFYTEDMQHGHRLYGRMEIVNPFLAHH